jgi:hypothetical protein
MMTPTASPTSTLPRDRDSLPGLHMDALAEPYQLAALALLLIISHQIKTASF